MAQPPEFIPQTNFTESGVSGADIDTLVAEISASLNSVIANLALIQRDDTKLKNQTVHAQALTGEALALINSVFDYTGPFSSGTAYTAGQSYLSGSRLYICLVGHTSSSVNTDTVLGNVVAVTSSDDAIANTGLVTVSTAGSGNSYIFTLNLDAYTDGENYNIIPNHTNTGAVTINRDTQGAKALLINGRAAQAGEIVSGRKIQIAFSTSLDSWELISSLPEKIGTVGASGLNILVTSNTAFNVVIRGAVLSNSSGRFIRIGAQTISVAVASAVMNGAYTYDNDKWYDVYIVSNGVTSEVRLVPDLSALTEVAGFTYSVRVGAIRNTGGNLVRTHQTGNQVRFLQDVSQRADAALDSASGLETVSLTIPVNSAQAELAFKGTISGATTTKLIVAQGSELLESDVFQLAAGSTEQTAIRTVYARNDSNVRKIDIKYSAGTSNSVSVNICGFIWR